MALPDKHQLKFNSHKDDKTPMEAIEKRFRGLQKLDSQLEIHGVSLSQEDVNLKFLQSTTTQNLAFVSSSNTDSTTDSGVMIGVIKQRRSLPTLLLWIFHLRALLLIMRHQPSGGYHAVPPPTTGTFMPPKLDFVFHTAPIAVETDHSAFTVQLSLSKHAQDLSHTNRPTAPIIEDWVSDSEDESKTKPHRLFLVLFSPLRNPKLTRPKSNRSGKRRNRKTCFVCKSVDHMIKDCDYHAKKMAQPTPRNYAHMGNNKQNASLTHKNPSKHMVPAAVLTQSKLVSIPVVRPVSAAVPKIMTSNSPLRVTAVEALVVSAAQGNMSYLYKFEELNGGYVAFGGNPKGGKISGKGKIKTCKLDFKDVYFVKELKFNLFSVLQMCDKKNSVLFTNTKCLVLSPDFMLPDES
nr:ribonuclease H-like domain-containing protein [Tanacetum cinerariifolium]